MAGNILGSIQVVLEAKTSTFATEMDKAAAKAKSSSREISSAIKKEMGESKASMALLGDEIGVTIPRHLRGFISQLPGVGKALSAAFNTVAVVALVSVVIEAGRKVYELAEAFKAAEDAPNKMREGFTKLNRPLEQNNDQLALTLIHTGNVLAALSGKTQNKLAESLAEARVEADKLNSSLEKGVTDFLNLIETKGASSTMNFVTNSGDNAQVQKLGKEYIEELAKIPKGDHHAQDAAELANRFHRKAQGDVDTNNGDLVYKPGSGMVPAKDYTATNTGLYQFQQKMSEAHDTADWSGQVASNNKEIDRKNDAAKAAADAKTAADKAKSDAEKAARPGNMISEVLANLREQLAAQKAIEASSGQDVETRSKTLAVNKANLEVMKLGEQLAKEMKLNTANWKPEQFTALVNKTNPAAAGQIHSSNDAIEQSKQTSTLTDLLEKGLRSADLSTVQTLRLTAAMALGYRETQKANALTQAENELLARGLNPSMHPAAVKEIAAHIQTVNDNSGAVRATKITELSEFNVLWEALGATASLYGEANVKLRKFDQALDSISKGLARDPGKTEGLTQEQRSSVTALRASYKNAEWNQDRESLGKLMNAPQDRLNALGGQLDFAKGTGQYAPNAWHNGFRRAGLRETDTEEQDKIPVAIAKFQAELEAKWAQSTSQLNALDKLDPKTPEYTAQQDELANTTLAITSLTDAIDNLSQSKLQFKPHTDADINGVVKTLNAEIEAITNKQLMDTGKASAGFHVFFSEFEREADDTATAVKSAMNSTISSVNSELVKAMTGQKTNWSDAFKKSGEGLINTGLKSAESGIMKAFGLGKQQHVIVDNMPAGGSSSGMGGLLGKAGGFLSKLFGGGGIGNGQAAAGIGTTAVSELPNMGMLFGGMFADGGSPDPYRTSIVGEKGIELFTPRGVSGTITSNKDLKGLGGGDSVTQHFNIDARGTNAAEVDTRVRQGATAAYAQAMQDGPKAQQERARRRPSSGRG